jgi:hypothetical protein
VLTQVAVYCHTQVAVILPDLGRIGTASHTLGLCSYDTGGGKGFEPSSIEERMMQNQAQYEFFVTTSSM